MPVEETADIDLGTDEKTFDELDRAAAKATKTLEKRNTELKKSISNASKAEREQKRLDNRGGIYQQDKEVLPSSGAPRDITNDTTKKTIYDIIDERINQTVNQKVQVGFREAFADQAGGTRGANTLLAFGKNPKKFATGLLRTIPFIGGIVAIGEFAQALYAEIDKLDAFFKKFISFIDDRINQLRSTEEEAHIRSGDIQLINTTTSGGTSPRESYNSMEQFNHNRTQLESDHKVRERSGL